MSKKVCRFWRKEVQGYLNVVQHTEVLRKKDHLKEPNAKLPVLRRSMHWKSPENDRQSACRKATEIAKVNEYKMKYRGT
jgi:hypothetical protein